MIKQKIKQSVLGAFYAASHATSLDAFWVRRRHLGGATILMYHAVTDAANAAWIDPRFSVTSERFERQMRFLERHRNPVSLSDLVAMLNEGATPPAGTVVVTFDDGYLDTLRLAGPILKRHSIPAAVFVVSGWVDNRPAPWVDLAYAALRHRRADRVEFAGETYPLGSEADAAAAFEQLCGRLIALPGRDRDALLDEVVKALDPAEETPRLLMNWNEIGDWLALGPGYEVGVHTTTHTDLTTLDEAALADEVGHCAAALETRFGISHPHFAFPYGRSNDLAQRVLRASTCRSALATEPMEPAVGSTDAYDLTRFDATGNLARLGFMTSGAYPDMPRSLLGRI